MVRVPIVKIAIPVPTVCFTTDIHAVFIVLTYVRVYSDSASISSPSGLVGSMLGMMPMLAGLE